MQRFVLVGSAILLIAIAIAAYMTLFTVHQTQQALILRFGEPRRVITEPGLNWKIPFMDTANFLDKRILALDSPAQEVIGCQSAQDQVGIGDGGLLSALPVTDRTGV